MIKKQLNLNGFDFDEIKQSTGLQKLDAAFLSYLKNLDFCLYEQLLAYRQQQLSSFPEEKISQLLIDCAELLENFIAQLFNIEQAVVQLQQQTLSHQPIFAFKTHYVLRQARRLLGQIDKISFSELNQWIERELIAKKITEPDYQLAIAFLGRLYLAHPQIYATEIETLTLWCVAALTTEEGQGLTKGWEMFHLPSRLDFTNLVSANSVEEDSIGRWQGIEQRQRDGFDLTDLRMSQRQVMAEIDYCVYCHKNQGDFCSRGFPVKKTDPTQGLKINPLGETLTGCPLEEKISEMHTLKKNGYGIAALAMVMVDNPMCPATGHRICNDCMKACIYQKQEPVNIPQIETRVLTEVLSLPWGVEIYDLLTRWNPFREYQWIAKPYNGLKVLVMGMGPAGFTLSTSFINGRFCRGRCGWIKARAFTQSLYN